jgi:hypothetical protein
MSQDRKAKTMVTAKLIGEADGRVIARQFAYQSHAIAWIRGIGLRDFDDQTARGEVWSDGKLVWTSADLQTPENKERDRIANVNRMWPGGKRI